MNWFFASGDLDFFWNEQLHALSWLPQVFRRDTGFGASGLLSLWLDYPFRLILKLLADQGFSWFFIEKLLWFVVFVVGCISSYRFAKHFLGKTLFAFVAPLIYLTNTYFLLLFGGGQLGVAAAYAFAPFALLKFIQIIDGQKKPTVRQGVLNGLYFSLLVSFDIRLAYLVVGLIGLYVLLHIVRGEAKLFLVQMSSIGISFAVSLLIHAFWVLPVLFAGNGMSILKEQLTNPGMLTFLSFADFSHALSLLHPNWPENLFGKVYFLQPEFLILPVLAFLSLLLVKPKGNERLHIVFLASVGLIGVFFAKGVNEPLGGIFQWMFMHVPGFVSFRDPTKFYLLTAIAYCVLIPYSLRQLSYRRKITWVVGFAFLAYWIFTIRALFSGQAAGNFKPISLPKEYVALKDFLASNPVPSRTLWIPQREKFAYYSDTHPLLNADELFHNASVFAIIALTKDSAFMQTLSDAGIRYVIVPQDLEQRLFMDNYRFDPQLREALISALTQTDMKRRAAFQDVAVFENLEYSMHQDIPPTASRQQRLANIGVLVSALSLIACSAYVAKHRKI